MLVFQASSCMATSITYMGSSFTVPPTFMPYYSLLVTESNAHIELHSSVAPLLELVVSDGNTVVDVLAGYGMSYLPLSRLVGSNGALVAIERESEAFACLEQNSINKPTWERTLLIHSDPTDVDNSLSAIVATIHLPCPDFIHFSDHAALSSNDTFSALLGSIALLERCQPLVLVDCRIADVAVVTSMVEFLHVATGTLSYELYWYMAEDQLQNGGIVISSLMQLRIVAVPSQFQFKYGRAFTVDKLHLEDVMAHGTADDEDNNSLWERVTQYVQQVNSRAAVKHTVDTVVDNASGATTSPYRIRTHVTVHLADITVWNSTIAPLIATHLTQTKLDTLRIPLVFSSQLKMERAHLIASTHCHVWTERLLSHLAKQLSPPLLAPVAAEKLNILRSCSAFVASRVYMLQRLYSTRNNTMLRTDATQSAAGAEGEPTHTLDTQRSAVHQNYNLTGSTDKEVMSQWFQRPPFGVLGDEVACGEPMWCSHAEEMQRRIRAWQFPEERPKQQNTKTDGAVGGSAKPWKDWSVDSSSTCATSKFLVYEPPSNMHGIGSMLELIAVSFRYAICLDRILVLRPYTNEPTLQKWIHSGCQGNFLECYFQPIGGCQLSAAEIAAAPLTKDGYQYDRYPLRDERVLVLKGMPLEGECTLCYSEWKESSRFFDGLFTGASAFNVSSMARLQHIAAIRSNVKLTWASHFLRYLLKPRAWFAETLSQIIPAAMQSPAPLSLADPEHSAFSVNGQELALSAFPTRYISLHVRFGMKVAEATLQPLTRYMDFISRKLPHLTDIFVSTETEEVIQSLIW